MPCIAHLDMDSFFVSVVRLRFPFLNDVPLVVGGKNVPLPQNNQAFSLWDYQGRGVIASASYQARELSLKSAMPLMKAAQIARLKNQNVALLPVLMNDNRFYSTQFKNAVREIAPKIEDVGIDEIYMDLSDFPDSFEAAKRIQQHVFQKTHLSCSIGLAPNKLMAKLASAHHKPCGLTVFNIPQDLENIIFPLSVNKINGIGKKMAKQLNALNIFTIGDLAKTPPDFLKEHFGLRLGEWLHCSANGIDSRALKLQKDLPQSIGAENTFVRDYHLPDDRALLTQNLNDLCQKISFDLKRKKMLTQSVAVKIIFSDFSSVVRSYSLSSPIVEKTDLLAAARQTLKYFHFKKPLRLLGVSARQLRLKESIQPEYFLI